MVTWRNGQFLQVTKNEKINNAYAFNNVAELKYYKLSPERHSCFLG